ncbi:DNA-binding transcription factor [Schizosaccharomyces pombe]|uniref:Uncharacterized transcriptional regulatory protein C3H8.08c n=1 Tax=Schizosaccharomyces pombe (strain 972 / ATCC 24843) TaxID=284812 RepID=YAS8_SCHPO|nr:putative transcription factor [Schizosaccharomyces pombe]Q10144.1 RecName: Full=Uncharacterized transcriptional regulatory protein C3H8.08c [Schizosaccharomyces pombe 972h-]CAA93165.1 transcription factor (predicted) [Schizosaccharomyces pombe]|eukprot:NP_593001.1 putative transcription factor [Schizosaccharomyces pombe]
MSSSPPALKKFRKRSPKSCLICRRRKVKCDRQQPCSRCKERNEVCTYADDTIDKMNVGPHPSHSENASDSETTLEVSPDINPKKNEKFDFYGWRSLFELIKYRKDSDMCSSRPSFSIQAYSSYKDNVVVESLANLLPPFCISQKIVNLFFKTLNVVCPIYDQETVEKSLNNIESPESFSYEDAFTLLPIIAATIQLSDLPDVILNFYNSAGITPLESSRLINLKLNEISEQEYKHLCLPDKEIIQMLLLRAYATKFRTRIRGVNTDLCRSIHVSTLVTPLFQVTEKIGKNTSDLWFALCEIDGLECVLKYRPPFIQHDTYGRLKPLRCFFNDDISYNFHLLLGRLLDCGVSIYKSVHSLTVSKFIDKLESYESQLSLILVDIEAKFYDPSNEDIQFRYIFLKMVFWTARVNLYQCFITLDSGILEDEETIIGNLGESCIQCVRLLISQITILEKRGWLLVALLEIIHALMLAAFCRDKGFEVPSDLGDITLYVQERMVDIVTFDDGMAVRFGYVLRFINSMLHPNEPPMQDAEPETTEDPSKLFADIFDFTSNYFIPSALLDQ